MSIFIEITTDPFSDRLSDMISGQSTGGRGTGHGKRVVRRPLRGLEIKEDCPAILKVVRSDSKEIPLIDAGAPDGSGLNNVGYGNFLLQNVTEVRMEKHQIVETFGESYIFFFGEQPRFLDVQVVLVNSHDFNWEAEWWENYEKYFRGTKLVELGARLYMFYDDNIVEGYMLNCQGIKVADNPMMVQLSFRMFVTSYRNISFIGDPMFPIRASVALPPNMSLTDLTKMGSAERLREGYRDQSLDKLKADAWAAESQRIDAEEDLRSGAKQRGFDAKKRLTNLMRSVPRTNAVSPDVYKFITDKKELIEANPFSSPLRGKISDNIDEYLGAVDKSTGRPIDYTPTASDMIPPLAPAVAAQQECRDLHQSLIDKLQRCGADVNNPTAIAGLGLSAVASAKASFSASARASVKATFKAQIKASASFNAGVKASAGAGFMASSSASARASAGFHAFAGASASASYEAVAASRIDALGVVYGRKREVYQSKSISKSYFCTTGEDGKSVCKTKTVTTSKMIDRTTVQGGGDRAYGYRSDYCGGRPGFGQPGWGDMGGEGHGSGQGRCGDPGFRDPTAFTYKGVSEATASYMRFNDPQSDSTVFNASAGAGARVGLGAGNCGNSGSGSTKIEGKPSAFAMIAVQGTLDSSGGEWSADEWSWQNGKSAYKHYGNDIEESE